LDHDDSDTDRRGIYLAPADLQWSLFGAPEQFEDNATQSCYWELQKFLTMTGIPLMRTGEVQANLVTLNDEFCLPYIGDLVARKLAGPEKSKLEGADIAFHESEYQRLRGELQAAHEASSLPESPSDETRAALNDLLLRMRITPRPA
jgi:predicted nucleotidyltransferase